jgi:hypothetical protein
MAAIADGCYFAVSDTGFDGSQLGRGAIGVIFSLAVPLNFVPGIINNEKIGHGFSFLQARYRLKSADVTGLFGL